MLFDSYQFFFLQFIASIFYHLLSNEICINCVVLGLFYSTCRLTYFASDPFDFSSSKQSEIIKLSQNLLACETQGMRFTKSSRKQFQGVKSGAVSLKLDPLLNTPRLSASTWRFRSARAHRLRDCNSPDFSRLCSSEVWCLPTLSYRLEKRNKLECIKWRRYFLSF